MSKSITQLIQEAHENAVSKGWWDEERSFGELIALIHSEASEALEDYRSGKQPNELWYEYPGMPYYFGMESMKEYNGVLGKPCGIPSELADIVIRIFDLCGRYGIDLEKVIYEKMTYNSTRSHKHGGKVI